MFGNILLLYIFMNITMEGHLVTHHSLNSNQQTFRKCELLERSVKTGEANLHTVQHECTCTYKRALWAFCLSVAAICFILFFFDRFYRTLAIAFAFMLILYNSL